MSARDLLRSVARQRCSQRWMQTSAVRQAITKLQMPAMSPTMTEGAIAHWKKKEGEPFSTGDILLEIETDKATIDVEAQDDGVMGKILAPDGTRNVKVGKAIALLAEEGDDISNLQLPEEAEPAPSKPAKEEVSPAQQAPPQPTPSTPESRPHVTPSSSRPLFPSVIRLLIESGIEKADDIKGTGVRGMLTKGDVLAYLGKASGPLGTYQAASEKEEQKIEKVAKVAKVEKVEKKPEPAPLDGLAIRRLIVSNMLASSIKARTPPASATPPDFDSIIADYLPPSPKPASSPAPSSKTKTSSSGSLDDLF